MTALATPIDRAAGPLYRQAAAVLRAAITAGRLRPGMTLPPEADLATGFAISLITVRQALRELEAEGLISKRSGRPATVTAGPLRSARVINTLEDVIISASDARLEIFSYAVRRNADAARALGLETAACHRLHGRLLVAEDPMTEITIYFPPAIGARLSRGDFDDVIVFRSVERRLGIRLSGALVTVAAELADAALARRLAIEVGAPVLTNRMLYRDTAGTPVELTVARHRADLYQFSYELRA
jgi:GntR family transcriptional regulator